jgi:hypothetical protein
MPTLRRFLIQRALLSSETCPVIKFTRRSFAQAGRQRKKVFLRALCVSVVNLVLEQADLNEKEQ